MNFMIVLVFLLIVLVGISLGLIGGGGSVLTVPILVYFMGLNPILATSYSLFIVGSTSMVGALINYRKGLVCLNTVMLFGMSSITIVYLTRKFLLPSIPSVVYKADHFQITKSTATMVLFAILMLIAAVAMICNRNKNITNETCISESERDTPKLLFCGILIGIITGLLGVGGGFLLIPTLVFILKKPMKEAIGTSLLIIALNSLIGFMGDIGHFKMQWNFLITITIMAIAGIFIGGFLAKKINGDYLKKAFGWFVLIMGIYILIREVRFVYTI